MAPTGGINESAGMEYALELTKIIQSIRYGEEMKIETRNQLIGVIVDGCSTWDTPAARFVWPGKDVGCARVYSSDIQDIQVPM